MEITSVIEDICHSVPLCFVMPGVVHVPVATHCLVCNSPGWCFRCYLCGDLYCGFCVRRHRGPAWDYRGDELDFKNEVAEGMPQLFFMINEKNASRAASDPAARGRNGS